MTKTKEEMKEINDREKKNKATSEEESIAKSFPSIMSQNNNK